MIIFRYVSSSEFYIIGIAFMTAGIFMTRSLKYLSFAKYKSMRVRIIISVILTTTALIVRGTYVLLLNNFDAEKYLIDNSVENNDWIFPCFIASYFGFVDLVPIIAQIISAWISIEKRRTSFQANIIPIMQSNSGDEKSHENSDWDYLSSLQSNSQNTLQDFVPSTKNSFNKTY